MSLTKLEKIVKYEGQPEMLRVDNEDITYQELAARIRCGQQTVVESKGPDGKKTTRALTVTNLGNIVFNDSQEDVRGYLQTEHVAEKEELKTKEQVPAGSGGVSKHDDDRKKIFK